VHKDRLHIGCGGEFERCLQMVFTLIFGKLRLTKIKFIISIYQGNFALINILNI